ncbi:hypothetical protein PsorP6_014875 [Peronosclerospora sorghi]|uniref:Uncharacterized protein n=1 Tax=Peronosclerospora sorghi TaxID=230839 RepID=A0ACC0VT73_9STRA|nr:hypothetical protein PsorP6_014875 [Peronosclerospora sorghi]
MVIYMFGRQETRAKHLFRRRVVTNRTLLVEKNVVKCTGKRSELPVASFFGIQTSCGRHTERVKLALAVVTGCTFLAAAALDQHAKSEETDAATKEQEKDKNPIQHVAALLQLYEQIDQNMTVFAARMLEDLEKRVAKEKKEHGGKLTVSPEQRALQMSLAFESTLEKVQDAVFRNNYVTKEHVQEAMQQLVAGTLRGGSPDGKISVTEAEMIDDYVRKLGRLRWKVTGSRDPLIPGAKATWKVSEEKPEIDVMTVINIMEELVPLLTEEMEKIAADLRKEKLSDTEFRNQLSQQYIEASGRMTKAICNEFKLNQHAFQAALVYYHDHELVEKALAKLAEDQQKRYERWIPLRVFSTEPSAIYGYDFCRFKELGL